MAIITCILNIIHIIFALSPVDRHPGWLYNITIVESKCSNVYFKVIFKSALHQNEFGL